MLSCEATNKTKRGARAGLSLTHLPGNVVCDGSAARNAGIYWLILCLFCRAPYPHPLSTPVGNCPLCCLVPWQIEIPVILWRNHKSVSLASTIIGVKGELKAKNKHYCQYTRPNRKSASSKHTLSGPKKTNYGLLMHYHPYSWLVLASSFISETPVLNCSFRRAITEVMEEVSSQKSDLV